MKDWKGYNMSKKEAEKYNKLRDNLEGLVFHAQENCCNQERWIDIEDTRNTLMDLIDKEEDMQDPCEYCELEPSEHIYAYAMNSKKIEVKYCPNCGRKIGRDIT